MHLILSGINLQFAFCLYNILVLFQTPKKDNEIVVVGEAANEDFFKLLYYILRGKLLRVEIRVGEHYSICNGTATKISLRMKCFIFLSFLFIFCY